VAMRIERDGRKEQYTYEDLNELATRVAGFLASEGVKPGDRVMLVSSNSPEWGMTYFGVLKAGATCIPCDPESSTTEILNFARAGNAAGIIIARQSMMNTLTCDRCCRLSVQLVFGPTTMCLLWPIRKLRINGLQCCRSECMRKVLPR